MTSRSRVTGGRFQTMQTLDDLTQEVYKTAVDKGWWDNPRTMTELLMLVVTECAEGVEEVRNNHEPTEVYFNGTAHSAVSYPRGGSLLFDRDGVAIKPEGLPIELADIIIRVLDIAGHHHIDIEEAMTLKMAYNATRPHRHGGKAL